MLNMSCCCDLLTRLVVGEDRKHIRTIWKTGSGSGQNHSRSTQCCGSASLWCGFTLSPWGGGLWFLFDADPDADPGYRNDADPCGSGSGQTHNTGSTIPDAKRDTKFFLPWAAPLGLPPEADSAAAPRQPNGICTLRSKDSKGNNIYTLIVTYVLISY
jgi:hypothetical protein